MLSIVAGIALIGASAAIFIYLSKRPAVHTEGAEF